MVVEIIDGADVESGGGLRGGDVDAAEHERSGLVEYFGTAKFKDLVYFTIDFDSQKDLVRRFGAQKQSTLISFHGATEQGRSVGDSNHDSIAALLNKVL